MKTKYKYIYFVEGLKDEWTIWNHTNGDYLGVIIFNKKWKEWEVISEPNTAYTKQCMIDLVDFIKQLEEIK